MPRRTDINSILIIGAALAFGSALSGCGSAPAEPRRQESFAELKARQDREFAASPDMRLPELRQRLHALGVSDHAIREVPDDYGEPIFLLTPDDATFDRIDKAALAKLELDSRYRLRLTDPEQIRRFGPFNEAETWAREKAIALQQLAQKGETDRIPRYRAGMAMIAYARSLEAYCGYGPGEALRVIDGHWLEYTHRMASDAALRGSRLQSYAPFACVKRVVDATDLGRHFIGNRGREGAIDS
jgi:hypothetical protein